MYKNWEVFNKLMDDPAFDAQTKYQMGREMIQAFPPEMLCSVSKSSLIAITNAMKGRLTNFGNTNDKPQTQNQHTPKETTPPVSSKTRKSRRSTDT